MYDLVVENYTSNSLRITPASVDISPVIITSLAQHKFSCSTSRHRRFRLSVSDVSESGAECTKEEDAKRQPVSLELSRRTKHGWEMVGNTDAPYTIYNITAMVAESRRLVILPKRESSSFLADMPSSVPLSSLLLPGLSFDAPTIGKFTCTVATHVPNFCSSVAFYGWPVSQCQDAETPLATQFALGIRLIDVRLSIIDGSLISYHGLYPQKLPFRSIIEAVYGFLTSPAGQSETIIVSVKQEDVGWELFSKLVHDEICRAPWGTGFWFLENRVPTLGEVRGKAVLFSRFGSDGRDWEGGLEGMGIRASSWPDSKENGFEWWLKGTQIKVQDWYAIPSFLSIPEKAEKAAKALISKSSGSVLSISFLSASSFPLALPQTVACGFGWPAWNLGVEGVNSRVGRWILSSFTVSDIAKLEKGSVEVNELGPRLRGWCLMDFFIQPSDTGLINLLIECNYRGRKTGEEGWNLS